MKTLRKGYTTGACAAAAAQAAAVLLVHGNALEQVDVALLNGEVAKLPISCCKRIDCGIRAGVIKDAGDDPDITDGVTVVVDLVPMADGDIVFSAGDGVGTVTKPGLSVPVGEPAINPGPREMIRTAIRTVTDKPLRVTVSIPGGSELARKTFNPRLGVEGGLSILGTSGRVRPYSHEALVNSLRCSLDVAEAAGVQNPILVPGNIGRRAAEQLFPSEHDAILEISNEWDSMLPEVARRGFLHILVLGHPGKLAKFPMGHWNTHSSKSPPAIGFVRSLVPEAAAEEVLESETVEGLFHALPLEDRLRISNDLAQQIRTAICAEYVLAVSVVLIDMKGNRLGTSGDLSPWT